MICSAYHYYQRYKIKETEVGKERGATGRKNHSRFIEETCRKRTPEGPGHRWKSNIKMYHKKCGWNGVNWINLEWDSKKIGHL